VDLPTVTIRPAKPEDATAMVRVRRGAILGKARNGYAQPTIEAWAAEAAPDRAALYIRDIADPEVIVLVAESGGEVIGFAIAVPAQEELSAIYVAPNPIGRVGQALLSELERSAFESAATLNCVAALSAAPFYLANGYTEQGSTTYLDGSGAEVPCVRMKKGRHPPTPATG
jgi:putative acetyltransferase